MDSIRDLAALFDKPICKWLVLDKGGRHEFRVFVLCEAQELHKTPRRFRYVSHTGDVFVRDAHRFTEV